MQPVLEGMFLWSGVIACGDGVLTIFAGMFIDKTANLVESFSGKRPNWPGFTILLIGTGSFLLGLAQLYLLVRITGP
jgi:hypothetical protein